MRLLDRRPTAIAAYALAALLALLELAVLWQALHPEVSADYRAYYLDRSTTCLPQPMTGVYTLGTEIDFRSGGDQTRELRPCGWDGPAGDGMHSIGTSSRLRFAIGEPQDLTLMLELTGVTLAGPPEQHVDVSVGGTPVGQAVLKPGETRRFTFPVPVTALTDGFAAVELDYPDAINPGRIANTYWRSVKLTAASLGPQ